MADFLHVFSTFAPGGPQVRAGWLWAALGSAYRHAVCAMDGRFDALELCEPDLAIRVIDPPSQRGSLAVVRDLRRIMSAQRPNLVLTYNWGAIEAVAAARTLGIPVVHHEVGFHADEARSFKRRRVWARRAILPRVRKVIVPSHKLAGIATGLWRLSEERVLMAPNGVPMERYAPRDGAPELRARLGIPADAFVVGSVGHLRREKNPVRLIETLAALDWPAHLLVVGDGPERRRVDEAARTAGLSDRVCMAAHVSDPREHYRAMDAFVISSDTEQMPVAVLEAMATGVPVVSTDVGDVARMVPESGRSLVVRPEAGALAAALDCLAQDAEARCALGDAGRERVRAYYSVEAMVAAYRDAYEVALAG